MQGLHLTGDLFDCRCERAPLLDAAYLAALCRDQALAAGLQVVDETFHTFPEHDGAAGGVTGALLLAESHLAVHTWPERGGVTLDVYVCNFTGDNAAKAQQLFDALVGEFAPGRRVLNRIARGDPDGDGAAAPAAPPSDAPGAASGTALPLVFDWLNPHAGYGFTATRKVASLRSPHQAIEIFDTPQFGRMLRLDGRMMTAAGEEFFYHEAMTHPAAIAHPDPRSVLVIGGGDGGSSEELLKHPGIGRIVVAELDAAVVDAARLHLREIHRGALDDPRLEIRIGDGHATVERCTESFDLIVLDLTDPDTPACHLYSEAFFALCQRRLNPGGLMSLHLGSPIYQPETVRRNARRLRRVFRNVDPLTLYVPLYGSLWCLALAGDALDPRLAPDVVAQRLQQRAIGGLRFYNAELHNALFALPTFVRELTDGPADSARGRTRLAA